MVKNIKKIIVAMSFVLIITGSFAYWMKSDSEFNQPNTIDFNVNVGDSMDLPIDVDVQVRNSNLDKELVFSSIEPGEGETNKWVFDLHPVVTSDERADNLVAQTVDQTFSVKTKSGNKEADNILRNYMMINKKSNGGVENSFMMMSVVNDDKEIGNKDKFEIYKTYEIYIQDERLSEKQKEIIRGESVEIVLNLTTNIVNDVTLGGLYDDIFN